MTGVKDLNSDGSTVEYLNGPGIDNKVRQESSTSGTLYYQTDHLGSTRALTDASGNVVERISYDSFGNGTGSARTRYGYTGRERDELTGLYYYRARWYDAQVGRFISEDPIGFRGGDVNLYAYVGNNPTNRIDPSGLAWLHYWPARRWRDGDKSPYGHITLQLDDGTYISYWPGEHIGSFDVGKCVPPSHHRTYIDDWRGEHNTDSEMIYIPGLDEAAVKRWWNNGEGHGDWCSGNNCADIVAEALRQGGMDIPTKNWIWSTPYDVRRAVKKKLRSHNRFTTLPQNESQKCWGGTARGC
jgi:RHS repeat-associated protein